MQTPGQNVPGTAWEKYKALRLQGVEKGKWDEAKDAEVRSFLGLPLVGDAPEDEDKPAEMVALEDLSLPDLRANAKSLGLKAGGSREQLIKRIAEHLELASKPAEPEVESENAPDSEPKADADAEATTEAKADEEKPKKAGKKSSKK